VKFSRAMKFVLSFLILFCVLSVTSVALAVVFFGNSPPVGENSVLWLRIPDGLSEHGADDLFARVLGNQWTVGSVVGALQKAKVDERISAVVVVPSSGGTLWGKVQEIRSAIGDFKTSGKPIVAYLESGGVQAYYLATICDEILMTPSSSLDLIGVAAYELFLRDGLDRLGIEADVLTTGDYKTAFNTYTESTLSPAHREMSASLNQEFFDQLVSGIAKERGMDYEIVQDLIDRGPLLATEAERIGLIDGLVYEDQMIQGLAIGEEYSSIEFDVYQAVSRADVGLEGGPKVAVIYVEGTIDLGKGGIDIQGGRTVGSETFGHAMRQARDDPTIQAIILRIDSPGGLAVAADIMWREITLAREVKPVIASMSDVAASGGYYIAAAADAVVAQPGTLTGSIGAFSGKFVVEKLFKKIGVEMETVKNGAEADLFSPVRPFSDRGRMRLQMLLDATYRRFLAVVSEGRGLTLEAVHEIGQGRVWTGRQAVDNGLVDILGGMNEALVVAKEQANIAVSENVTIVSFPRPQSFFEQVSRSLSLISKGAYGNSIQPGSFGLDAAILSPVKLMREGSVLLLMPDFVWH